MAVSAVFDPGPPANIAQHFANLPSYAAHRDLFWYDWGPVFYRGRLDGSVKLLGIASDPGPTEQIACRTLVGDAGQRVQGFLSKLGLTTSYVLVNAHPVALHPGKSSAGMALLDDEPFKTWRNDLFDLITGLNLQVIVAFGRQAQRALDLWANRPAGIAVQKVPHPSSDNVAAMVTAYATAITALRTVVTPDAGGNNTGPNYGAKFTEADYSRIPRADLGFGVPPFLGDEAWARTAVPRKAGGVKRDGDHKLIWRIPENQP